MRALALLPFLLLIQSLNLYGQEAAAPKASTPGGGDPPPEYVPVDTEEYWKVGLTGFQAVSLSPENLYLTRSLPLLLSERLSGIHTHFFGPAERLGYQQWILRQEQRRLGQSLQSLRQERDALFFRELKAPERSSLLEAADAKITAAVEQLNALREMDPGLIEFPESKPILFGQAGGEGARGQPAVDAGTRESTALIEAPVLSPLRIARQEELDLLIWGTLEEVQGYLYLEVRALDARLGREVFYYSDAAAPEELYGGLAGAAGDLSRLLWGRDWSSLAVETTPPGGEVYIDGVFAGRAPLELEYLLPGTVEVRVEAQGFRSERMRLELLPYARVRQAVVLEPRPADPLLITSTPPGASIYDGSTWLGTTPLSVQRPESLSRLVLRLKDYPEQVLYLGPDSQARVPVSFSLDQPGPEELQAKRRNAFYAAFGAFALSLPVPLFFWGATNDSYAAYLQASAPATYNPSEASRLAGQVEGLYNTYLATLGISGALLVNMVVHLIRYINSSDRRG